MFLFCKQKTAYEIRISDWSSDVCSSNLAERKGLVDVDAVDRRHDRHIIAGQAVEIGVAVCAAQIGLGIDPLHDDRGRIVAPAVHFRDRKSTRLNSSH